MKRLFLLLWLVSTSCFAGSFQWNDKWTGQDKTLHLVVGSVIGGSVTALTENDNYGMVAGCGVGMLKELSDMHHVNHTASIQDFAASCLGSVIGAQLVKGLYLIPNGLIYSQKF